MIRRLIAGIMCLLATASVADAQTPTPAEIEQWKKDLGGQVLESSPCKKISWLLERERTMQQQPIRLALGWWGRGFIEGAVFMIEGEKGVAAQEKVSAFGLSVEVVSAHISTYCHSHDADTPADAIQALLLNVLK